MSTTPPRQFRAPGSLWAAYAGVCQRRGTTRAADLVEHMRQMVLQHGDRAELWLLEQADAELAARRDRR